MYTVSPPLSPSLSYARMRARTHTHAHAHTQATGREPATLKGIPAGAIQGLTSVSLAQQKKAAVLATAAGPCARINQVCVCVEHMHPCTHVFLRACMYACTYTTTSKTRIVMASEVSPRRCTPTTRPPAKTPVLAPRPVDMTLASSCVLSSPRCRTRIRSVFASTSHKNKTKRARARGAATAD